LIIFIAQKDLSVVAVETGRVIIMRNNISIKKYFLVCLVVTKLEHNSWIV